jgi:hypothetical protein
VKNKAFLLSTQIAVMVLALSSVSVAEGPRSTTLKGTINDYNPFAMGGYEIRGTWSLEVSPNIDAVDFRAALNMEHSDLWMISNKTTDTTLRDQHTHHFTMTNARVISDPHYVAANCPTAHFAVAATTTGFVVLGMAGTTGNGGNAPFAPDGEKSQLMVCVTGSNEVPFSNITLAFAPGSKASNHFGTVPINGVVRH